MAETPKLSDVQIAIRDAVKTAVSETIKEAVPVAVMAAQSSQRQVDTQKELDLQKARLDSASRCGDCGQMSRACKGEHVQIAVFPRDDSYAEWFTGLWLNGVRYLSNDSNHLVTVPKENDFEHMLTLWAKSERELRQGRKRNASASAVYA